MSEVVHGLPYRSIIVSECEIIERATLMPLLIAGARSPWILARAEIDTCAVVYKRRSYYRKYAVVANYGRIPVGKGRIVYELKHTVDSYASGGAGTRKCGVADG